MNNWTCVAIVIRATWAVSTSSKLEDSISQTDQRVVNRMLTCSGKREWVGRRAVKRLNICSLMYIYNRKPNLIERCPHVFKEELKLSKGIFLIVPGNDSRIKVSFPTYSSRRPTQTYVFIVHWNTSWLRGQLLPSKGRQVALKWQRDT